MSLPVAVVGQNAVDVVYLIAAIGFILGIRRLASATTARSGNILAAGGMLLAILFTLLRDGMTNWELIFPALAVGAVIGLFTARLVKMTAMPQMVAIFNGLGGGAAVLVALSEYRRLAPDPGALAGDVLAATLFSALIGAVTFSGSVVAFAKLQELLSGAPTVFPRQQLLNGALFALAVAFAIVAGITEDGIWIAMVIVAALALGVLFVLPIGGADMPVVIAFLNAFSGLSAVSAGFVLSNNALIIGGTLVGASGTMLTLLMARAMNRSVVKVLFATFGQAQEGAAAAGGDGGAVRETSADDVAVMLKYATQVMVVPGYGLAVAQAQHTVRELADLLEENGVQVKYAIHPVAGRMPGHMNVLLAEANVPYPQLLDMDDANPQFPRSQVALVIGANDVTNPAARYNEASPLYGMPILDVDKAENVVVLKRSMSPGFAGVSNELYLDPKCAMLFGDAKASLEALIKSAKDA